MVARERGLELMTTTEGGCDPGDRAGSRAAASPSERLRGKRILVIEDVRIIADYLTDLLRDFGCLVVGPFPDGIRARHALETGLLDGAVLDQPLSGQAFSAAARTLRERGVPLLYITGYGAELEQSGLPAAPVLEKPFTPREFAEAVLQMLG